jgi:hypothetical protein
MQEVFHSESWFHQVDDIQPARAKAAVRRTAKRSE